ncbi:alpha/beta fold hydrolase [Bordetella genomosp. 13]|uniref:alpha/beta fold hydrolase n=1 Tax=Bordetella genomosp. 13 TaxID=463040 RepID=UPI00119C94C8|nr:alpha/beta hydrolase [Bordetella genomosp. 13]
MNPPSSITPAALGYVQYGSGPAHVLVLHDWLGDRANYDAIIPHLDGSAFTYVFADLRGYGSSMHLPGAYTVDEIAADCLALADRLGWQRFYVMGHSMTGLATQRIAADAPERVAGAIAVCAVSAAGKPLDPPSYAFFRAVATDDDAFRRLVGVVAPGLPADQVEAKLLRHRQSTAPKSRVPYLDMFVHANFAQAVHGLPTRYLVVAGEHDQGLDVDMMQRTFMVQHPNARLHVMKNCGHYPMQERPREFAELVQGFLRG